MRWFKHLTDAHDSNDLTKIRMKFGAEGYAVYWYCLELIAGDLGEKGDITFELKHDAEVVAYNLRMDSVRVEEVMRFMVNIGLFESSHGRITCLKLAKYLDKNFTRNKEIHAIIDESKRLETVSDSQKTNTDSLRLSQGEEKRREEKREEKKEDIGQTRTPDRFHDFWLAYPKKVKKKDALKAWKSKRLDTRAGEIIADVENRKINDGRWLDGFIPDPTTYLRGERWADELTPKNKRGSSPSSDMLRGAQ